MSSWMQCETLIVTITADFIGCIRSWSDNILR